MPWRWRIRDGIATMLMWLLYAVLINAAIVGFWDVVHGRVTTLEGARVVAVAPTLQGYGVVILINAAILIGWAVYNWLRFRGPDRRRGLQSVPPEVVAQHFGVDPDLAARMSRARIGVLHHDAQGRVIRFDEAEAAPVPLDPPIPVR